MNGIFFGLIAMLGFGLSNAIAKVPIKEIGGEKTILYRNIFISLWLFLALVLFGQNAVFSVQYILIAVFIAIIGYLPLLFFYKALSLGKVGIISPVANSSTIFTVILSIIFFHERISMAQGLSIALIMLGIILVSLNIRDLKSSHIFKASSGVPYALVTSVLWGLVFFLWKIPVNVLGPILTSFIIEFVTMLCSAGYMFYKKQNFGSISNRALKYIFLVSLGGSLGSLAYNMGIKDADVSIVSAITFASPLIAALYGKFVFKEKLSKLQYLAIVFIVSGVILISYLS